MRSVFWLFFIFYYVVASLVSANNEGFSIMMYHRDGPLSPFHDPNLTNAKRFAKAIDRDFARINRSFSVVPNTLEAPLKGVDWTYLIKISLGIPPYEFFAGADTGSSRTWIQCKPCRLCYPMHQDVFDPTKSKTYRKVECIRGQIPCPRFSDVKCVRNVCQRTDFYGDGSSSKGVLSTDVMTIGSKGPRPLVRVKDYIFGCGHYNKGEFKREEAGIIGLGRGRRSLITQLGRNINGKFSYCLFRYIHGKLNFGHNAIVEGPGTVTTSLFEKQGRHSEYYFASLEAMTIGNERVEYNDGANIIIDSGTTLTYFTGGFYVKVVNSVKRQITATLKKDPKGEYETCFENDNGSFQFIPMTAHFIGGANVRLNKFNVFQTMEPGLICFMVAKGPISTWGNVAQMDFLVGFDVKAATIKFKPADCRQDHTM